MEATILGCGEAFDESLPNTCALLRTGAATMLFDCGYSAPPRVWKAAPGAAAIDLIYVSHAHADHYFGLPALLARMWEEGRSAPLTIVSQPAVNEQIRALLELGYRGLPGRFQYPVEFRDATEGGSLESHGAVFRFGPSLHAVTNLAVRVESGGQTFAYSGDGMFTDAGRALFQGAGLLVHEAFDFEHSPVHADIGRLLDMAATAGVGHLAMVHVQRTLRRSPQRIHQAIAGAGALASLPQPGAVFTI